MVRSNIFKIVIVGEGNVGKTSLVKRYVDDVFTRDLKSTVGVDLSGKLIESGGVEKLLQIWDLGGQPRFRSISDIFFKGASGMLAVFDVTRRESLHELDSWIKGVQFIAGRIATVVVGNKVDLRSSRAQSGTFVTKDEGIRFASKFNSPYIETSAKEGQGVEEAFMILASRMGS